MVNVAPVPLPFVLTGEIALNVPAPLAIPSMLAPEIAPTETDLKSSISINPAASSTVTSSSVSFSSTPSIVLRARSIKDK